ncbi:MAG: hypothetical protein ACREHF_01870 [Rhizomicrobium sp.]
MRTIRLLPAVVLFLSGAAWAAETGPDTTSAVMSDCSSPGLSAASVDSCLERVRILEETDSAPGLASLEARLEARVAQDHEPVGPVPAGSAAVEVRPYAAPGSPDANAGPAEEARQTATDAPRTLQTEEPPAPSADDSAAGNTAQDRVAPDDQAPDDWGAAADSPPPDISPDDEPPIADPPDSDAGPRAGEDGPPPGDPDQGGT